MAPEDRLRDRGVSPFLSSPKTWPQIMEHVVYWRNWTSKFRHLSSSSVSTFKFSEPWDNNGAQLVRIYCLGAYGKMYTICYVDVQVGSLTADVPFRSLSWAPLLSEDPQGGVLGPKEELLRERMRSSISGITSYQLSKGNSTILLTSPPKLYFADDSVKEDRTYAEPLSSKGLTPLDPQICPTLPKLIAFVADENVHLICDDAHAQATFNEPDSGNISGSPSFVMQEEFDRYSGLWWAPNHSSDGKYMLLYEEVDESSVPQLFISTPGCALSDVDKMRYPRVGASNAVSTVNLLIVEPVFDENNVCQELNITELNMMESLQQLFPWAEYLVRAGWLPDSSAVWVELLSRNQDHMVLVHIPVNYFVVCTGSMRDLSASGSTVTVLYEETNPVWIYPHNSLVFIRNDGNDESVEFIWTSETTGFRHLYLVESQLSALNDSDTVSQPNIIKLVPLTTGDWSVLVKAEATLQYEIVMNPCNSQQPMETPSVSEAAIIYPPRNGNSLLDVPKLIQYTSNETGLQHYALLFLPENWTGRQRYPIVLQVYAGPEIQLVQNIWMCWRGFQKYTSLGYAVVMIDGRGSANRGLKFEGYIKHKMGCIEVNDQVEGIEAVAAQSPCPLDLGRVAIFGWSYGGYVALLGLVQRPDIFKVAIAGGPVTSWSLYDTGYTERYMGMPNENVEAYKLGDVVNKASAFPDTPGRLLLVHGLIDENVHFEHTAKLITALQKASKPYQLQIFPRERHGLRSVEANNHLDASILLFIQQNL